MKVLNLMIIEILIKIYLIIYTINDFSFEVIEGKLSSKKR